MKIEIKIDDKTCYIKMYKLRRTGRHGATLETSIPKEIFERECRKQGLNFDEGVEKLQAVWRYGDFPGVYLTFENSKEYDATLGEVKNQ